jgi:hypothetical protein
MSDLTELQALGQGFDAGWRDIASAPKDGTRIRVGHERDISSMRVDGMFPVRGSFNGRSWELSAFFIVPGGRYGLMSNEPTHWLPDPVAAGLVPGREG